LLIFDTNPTSADIPLIFTPINTQYNINFNHFMWSILPWPTDSIPWSFYPSQIHPDFFDPLIFKTCPLKCFVTFLFVLIMLVFYHYYVYLLVSRLSSSSCKNKYFLLTMIFNIIFDQKLLIYLKILQYLLANNYQIFWCFIIFHLNIHSIIL